MFKINKILLIIFLPIIFIGSVNLVFASNETQDQLEQELKDVQQQIDEFTKELSKTQTQKETLANKIKQLKTRQKTLSLQIQQTTLKLSKISGQLNTTENSIKKNISKQKILQGQMVDMFHQINILNDNVLIQLLDSNGFVDAYNKYREYTEISKELKIVTNKQKVLAKELLVKQTDLEGQKSEADNLLKISSIQKSSLVDSLTEQNTLLTETKGLESNFQTAINDRKKLAAEIRNRIYELFNTGKQIDFGQAVDIAKMTSKLTGVRPALLLAILTQESSLGKNVGTCNRSGDPKEKSWQVVMKPERDQKPFIQITQELGLDIDTTPISCPMRDKNGKQVGWGGAMGPAQFIPSTWMGYKNKVISLSGKSTANPWDIRDAFLASAIKLKSDGADGTQDGEWKAAMKYFAGSVNLAFRFYADNVMATAKKYQVDIDAL